MASQLLATKSIAELHEQESSGNELRRTLTATQLTLLGIGGVIGTGIFVLTGVAAGRVDAFWEIGLSAWDTAAGTLLIQEAGGRIGTLTGAEYRQAGHVVAGTPKVYAALIELLAPHVPAELRAT